MHLYLNLLLGLLRRVTGVAPAYCRALPRMLQASGLEHVYNGHR
jgi:hypothetical protein